MSTVPSDVSSYAPIRPAHHDRSWVLVPIIGIGSLVMGVAALVLPWQVAVGAMLAAVMLAAILRSAYIGLVASMAWLYVRPDEFVPGLHLLHMQKLMVLLVLAALFLNREKRTPLSRPAVLHTWALLAFFAVVGLSVVGAYWRGAALTTTEQVFRYVAFYLIALWLLNSVPRLSGYTWALIVASAWLAITTIKNYHAGMVVSSGDLERAAGTNVLFEDPNDLAAALIMALPFAYFAIWATKRRMAKVAGLLLIGALAYAVMLTGSRGGTLSFAALVPILVLRSPKRGWAFLGALLLTATFWFSASPQYRERILSIGQVVRSPEEDESVAVRRAAWAAGRQMFLDHPLIGAGAGNFEAAWAALYSDDTAKPYWKNSHSVYYQLAGELGLAGIVTWSLLIYAIFRDNRRLRRELRRCGQASGYVFLMSHATDCALVSLLVSGAFISILYHPLFFTVATVAACLRRLSLQTATAEEPAGEAICAVSAA